MWTQMFPPKPTYTEEHVPDLGGKVCRKDQSTQAVLEQKGGTW